MWFKPTLNLMAPIMGAAIALIILLLVSPYIVSNPHTILTSTGFGKIHPKLSKIMLTQNGDFKTEFIQGLGKTIRISNVRIESKNISCTGRTDIESVAHMGTFRVHATDCIGGQKGDRYDINVLIEYEATVDGNTTYNTESGSITGKFI